MSTRGRRNPRNRATAAAAAFVAELAYCDTAGEVFERIATERIPGAADQLADATLPGITVVRNGDAAACVIRTARNVWLGVRGSDSLADFRQYNFRVDPVELGDHPERTGRVHGGFWNYSQSVAAVLPADVADSGGGLVVCGHSLGAAAGAILAAEFAAVRFYGFGMPRVFDKSAGLWFRRRVDYAERWVDRNDPVAKVPRLRYRHATPAHYHATDGRVYYDPGPLFVAVDRLRSRFLAARSAAGDLLNAVVAYHSHSMAGYRRIVDESVNFEG